LYKKQNEISVLNETLEDKVTNRTNKLNNMYENEKYLKDVLKLVADVNEMLVKSHSFQTIAKNSINKLIQHKQYKFIWTALYHDNLFEIIYRSSNNTFLQEENIKANTNNQLCQIALKAIKTNSTIIHKIQDQDTGFENNEETANFTHNICIPYSYNNIEAVMSIYCDVTSGFKKEEIDMLEQIVHDISNSMNTQAHKETIEKMEDEKISNYEETILAFVHIIEQRDTYTAGHTIRVAQYCKIIAQELKIKDSQIKKLEQAAILHDIGKVAIPDSILLKPGKLTSLEYELIKYHSEAGYKMLLKIDMYKELATIIRYHHSRFDGKGYPQTNHISEIPFLSHILIVADAFDAITTNRIYKTKKDVKEALIEIKKGSGTQFHPDIVTAALTSLKDIKIEHTTQLPNNELEKKRFAYFFHDSLTGLFNENYLDPLLKNEMSQLKHLYHIQQHNFSSFNEKKGWDEGNNLLKNLASLLLNKVDTDKIFRFHGDDFIILTQKKIDEKKLYEHIYKLIKETDIFIDIKRVDINSSFNIKDLK